MQKNAENKAIIVVLGPTASGKSALAVELALQYNGEIISADSRQVYRGMNIGTGKITKKEMRGVRHHLLDIASPKKKFDVVRWKKMADKAVAGILSREKLPIICGGTGLYIKAFVENITYPDVPPNPKLRARLETRFPSELFAMLKKLDPARAKTIDRYNPRRLKRAIEIAKALGKVPRIQTAPRKNVLIIGIKKSPEKLKITIKKRLADRIKKGMIAEVKRLRAEGISWKRMEEMGLEYKYLALFLQNKMTKKEMTETLAVKIWQYAGRQMTWFRNTPDTHWITTRKQAEELTRLFIQQGLLPGTRQIPFD